MDTYETYVLKMARCWEWLGAAGGPRKKYGSYRGRRAHRVAYEKWVGPIPPGKLVCHRCDNTLCVNPEHLYLGTPAENSADMVRKRRQYSKLTPEMVVEIRASAGTTHDELAKRFGVARPTVTNILAGRRWKHVAFP